MYFSECIKRTAFRVSARTEKQDSQADYKAVDEATSNNGNVCTRLGCGSWLRLIVLIR